MKRNLQSIIWREGRHYVAQCLNVDVSSFGDSKDEALVNLREALVLYFEDFNVAEVAAVEEPELVSAVY